ncbi:MAG: redox-regulated ATPase YchF [bacterium]|nr:redox-regulated ATPase YchF [bacterium]
MEIGIIGLPGSGKTTIFNVLAKEQAKVGAYSGGGVKANLGVVEVPDERLDYLAEALDVPETIYARINYIDLAGLGSGDRFELSDKLVRADALAVVLRAFDDPNVAHPAGSLDVNRDLYDVASEILLADLMTAENRIADLGKYINRGVKERQAEYDVFLKCRDILEREIPLREAEFAEDELTELRPYPLLTLKPLLVIVNIGEEDIRAGGSEPYRSINDLLEGASRTAVTEMSGKIEMELAGLSSEERAEFAAELGIEEPGCEETVRVSYRLLDLVSFFTFTEKECRAWTIKRGTLAKRAAGKVHSDMERGFIRAEVVAFDDFEAAEGSMNKVKETGRFRAEGKEYEVKDGDIFTVRFQV